MPRKIPATGINLFQLIYRLIREYEELTGLRALNLSLGNPDTGPPKELLALQSRYAGDARFELHTYAEDNNLGGFAERMVELHGGVRVEKSSHLRVLPIPGIKTATCLLPLACGLHSSIIDPSRTGFRLISNLPAYDVIGSWTEGYLGARRLVWPLVSADEMRLRIEHLVELLDREPSKGADLLFVIRPGNPSAVGATEREWREIIELCVERNIRLVNDAAYAGLAGSDHVPLARVAEDVVDLEWIEMYSVSKSFSDPGARLGALVGSRDFVEDFNLIKGNTESGPVPYVMAAYGEYLEDRERARGDLERLRSMYQGRLDYVIDRFLEAGMRQACPTGAGFFTLWKVPRRILGISLADHATTRNLAPHEAFNRHVIRETGIVGVHFEGPSPEGRGEPLIRYAVCEDVLDPAFQVRFEAALARFEPEY